MTLLMTAPDPVPLTSDADGVVRIGSTRVTLDTVVRAFREGMNPEGIVEQYPVLRLADVYSVIGYVLTHPSDVETFLDNRELLAAEVRQQNEARWDPVGVRDRLLARRQTR